ncbi:hypothetical protein VCRA2117O143_530018 [Vibrio crassostreae]|nr:hypothetical protein VCRA2117O143_530018 [Vibrio crassostreae]
MADNITFIPHVLYMNHFLLSAQVAFFADWTDFSCHFLALIAKHDKTQAKESYLSYQSQTLHSSYS